MITELESLRGLWLQNEDGELDDTEDEEELDEDEDVEDMDDEDLE